MSNFIITNYIYYDNFFLFLLHLRHMEILGPEIKSELWL